MALEARGERRSGDWRDGGVLEWRYTENSYPEGESLHSAVPDGTLSVSHEKSM